MTEEPAKDPAKLGAVAVRAAGYMLQLGAEATRAVAEAASGRPQQAREGESPLSSMIRHGSTAAGSLVALTVAAARQRGAASEGAANSAAPGAAPAPQGPRLQPGSVARVPLSIDNPGGEPMAGLAPAMAGATYAGEPARPAFTLSFQPESLTVAPRDFEKLVVTLHLDPDIPEGSWTAMFKLTPDGDPHELPFQVTGTAAG